MAFIGFLLIDALRLGIHPLSPEVVSKKVDSSVDNTPTSNGYVRPGVSIRYGPVDDRDVEMQDTEANGTDRIKRKSRGTAGIRKSYAEESSEDDKPLVCHVPFLPFS
jgi:DNA topoisomerase-1